MMMQTFAYEIGAAFLLAALLMGASFMRGFFSAEFLKNVRFAVIGLAVVLLGIAAYSDASVGSHDRAAARRGCGSAKPSRTKRKEGRCNVADARNPA
jgi:hypothetical protein